MHRGVRAAARWTAVILGPALAAGAADPAGAATKSPCARQPELRVLARQGTTRIVEPPGSSDVYACTPSRPRGLRLARGSFSEPCGSNSSRSVGVFDKSGAALGGRYALIAVNVVNDNCRSDDAFQVLRWNLATARRTVVASGRHSYADRVAVNAAGTAVWTVDDKVLRLAAPGETPKTLLAGGVGSGTPPSVTRIGSGRRPTINGVQGASPFRLDTARHLAARRRCGSATAIVTPLVAAGNGRLCLLSTGRSVARAGCTQVRGTVALCATQLIDVPANRVVFTHPGLAGRHGKVGSTRYDQDILDALAVSGGRAVVIREGAEETSEQDSKVIEQFSELLLLLPDGTERSLRRTSSYVLRGLRVEGSTVRWRETDGSTTNGRSVVLP